MAKPSDDFLAMREAQLNQQITLARQALDGGLDGNRRQKRKNEPQGQAYLFRKIRLGDGSTVLEPIADVDRVTIAEGDQFVTGWLDADPGWTAVRK